MSKQILDDPYDGLSDEDIRAIGLAAGPAPEPAKQYARWLAKKHQLAAATRQLRAAGATVIWPSPWEDA